MPNFAHAGQISTLEGFQLNDYLLSLDCGFSFDSLLIVISPEPRRIMTVDAQQLDGISAGVQSPRWLAVGMVMYQNY
jgi:hypothetical protein